MTDSTIIAAGILLFLVVALVVFSLVSSNPTAIAMRAWFKVNWIKMTGGVVLLGIFIAHAATRKKDNLVVDKRENEMREKLAEARTQAALEIGRAQGKEQAVKDEVAKIAETTDKKKQLQELADLVNRTRKN